MYLREAVVGKMYLWEMFVWGDADRFLGKQKTGILLSHSKKNICRFGHSEVARP